MVSRASILASGALHCLFAYKLLDNLFCWPEHEFLCSSAMWCPTATNPHLSTSTTSNSHRTRTSLWRSWQKMGIMFGRGTGYAKDGPTALCRWNCFQSFSSNVQTATPRRRVSQWNSYSTTCRISWISETLVWYHTTCWTRERRKPTETALTTLSAHSLATATTLSLQIKRAVSWFILLLTLCTWRHSLQNSAHSAMIDVKTTSAFF